MLQPDQLHVVLPFLSLTCRAHPIGSFVHVAPSRASVMATRRSTLHQRAIARSLFLPAPTALLIFSCIDIVTITTHHSPVFSSSCMLVVHSRTVTTAHVVRHTESNASLYLSRALGASFLFATFTYLTYPFLLPRLHLNEAPNVALGHGRTASMFTGRTEGLEPPSSCLLLSWSLSLSLTTFRSHCSQSAGDTGSFLKTGGIRFVAIASLRRPGQIGEALTHFIHVISCSRSLGSFTPC